MANVKKNKTGYGYKYADIAQIHEYLESVGMSYYQTIETVDGVDYVITYPIIDGKELPPRRGCRVVQASLSGKSNAAQEQGSGLTYARRYSLLLAFGLATEDDDAESMTVKKTAESKNTETDGSTINSTQIIAIKGELERTGVSEGAITNYIGKDSFEKFSQVDYIKVMKKLNKTASKEDK